MNDMREPGRPTRTDVYGRPDVHDLEYEGAVITTSPSSRACSRAHGRAAGANWLAAQVG
jgi:hypothetical protein